MKYIFLAIIILVTTFEATSQTRDTAAGNKGNGYDQLDKRLVEEKKKPVNIPFIGEESSLTIDGKPDEEVWKQAAVFNDFIQTHPGDNIAPSKQTKAFVMYDAKNLYISFRCWDEKDKIRASVAKRDEIFGEDNVRVWLDTYDDDRRAYLLGWNPFGIQLDGIYVEGQGLDTSLDIIMESKGVIEDWGWSVEVKIPFKSLRYSAGEGKSWGFNAARNIDRLNDELDSWMPRNLNEIGFLSQNGTITGLDHIKTERLLEIVPSVTLSETGKRVSAREVAEGRFVNQPVKQEYGATVKFSVTPNITLDAAINPDFAEIEADSAVITSNQRFPIFFEEKRPFFLEGADIFESPLSLFHSRTIVDPDFATKLTGKIGKNSFGFLVATDNAPGNYDENSRNDPNVYPFIKEFVGKNALFAVARGKRDFGKENTIGFFSTARIFPENRNFVGGADGLIKFDAKSYFQYQVAGSYSRKCFFDPEFDNIANPAQAITNGTICGGAVVNGVQRLGNVYSEYRGGKGLGYFANYGRATNLDAFEITATGRSKDFRSEAGFFQRNNSNNFSIGYRKSTKSNPKAKIIRMNWGNGASINFDWKARLQNLSYNSNLNFSFQRNTFLNIFGGIEREILYEEEFGLKRNANRTGTFYGPGQREANQPFFGGYFRIQPSKYFTFQANPVFVINAYDLDFGAGPKYPRVSPPALANQNAPQDPGIGNRADISAGVEILPIDPWRLDLSYNFSRLKRKDTDRVAYSENVFSLRSTYQFTRFLFVRARVDYNTLNGRVGGQYLLGWTPNPGTAFYAGYNDISVRNGYNPFNGAFEPGFAQQSRTFFIRASYLFRRSF